MISQDLESKVRLKNFAISLNFLFSASGDFSGSSGMSGEWGIEWEGTVRDSPVDASEEDISIVDASGFEGENSGSGMEGPRFLAPTSTISNSFCRSWPLVHHRAHHHDPGLPPPARRHLFP